MCLVQINFVVVGLKQKCLGLHWMCVNNGTEDNIVVDEVLVEGLGWEVHSSPDPKIEPLFVQVEFSDVAMLGQFKIDHDLVTTLVERWRPKLRMFHLLVGECTITLENIALQQGLRVDGRPVTGPRYYDWEQKCI